MFNEIRIENFKCFSGMQKIPLKPITLLYGPNSSGKSSILQSLLLFKQTLEASGNEEIVLLPKGDLVDLGGYSEFVNGHDAKKEITIGFSFKHLWGIVENNYPYTYYDVATDSISLEFTFIAVPGFETSQKEILVKSIRVFDRPNSEPVAVYKNVWFCPKLRRAIMRKVEKAKRDKDDPAIVQKWVSDLRRSVMVLESIGFEPHGWTNEAWSMYQEDYGSRKKYINDERFRRFRELGMKFVVGSGLAIRPILDGPDGKEVRLSVDGAMRKGDFSKDDEEFFRKLACDRQPGLVEEINKLKTRLKSEDLKEVERKKIKQAVGVLKKVDKSLFNNSFEEFSNIKEYCDNSLIFLSKGMPKNLLNDGTKTSWLLQEISELEELTGLEDLYWEYTDMIPNYLIIWAADWVLSEYIKKIQYIGPLREFPERVYSYSGNVVSTVGKSGKFTPDILFARPEIKEKVNHWLDKFDTGYELDVKPLMGDLFALLLRDKETKCEVSPKDVGFGISQLLPIIVQGVTSQNNIICIEQPEIHVHPRLQAELGSFFAECADKYPLPPYGNDFPPEPGNQFIIETHSENLVLRLQKLIRKGELKKEHVAVVYFDKTPNGTVAKELRLNDKGEFIDPWPHGFFEESFDEMFGE